MNRCLNALIVTMLRLLCKTILLPKRSHASPKIRAKYTIFVLKLLKTLIF